MKWYVYGLIESADVAPIDVTGLGGSTVRVEPAGPVHAIVSDFPGTTLSTDKESVLAHQAVLENVLQRQTPLPFRFGNVVTPEQLTEFVEKHSATLLADFKTVRGCVQMSVKVVTKATVERAPDPDEGPGTQFLRQKQVHRDALVQAAEWLNAALNPLIRSVDTNIRIIPRPIASIAHLIGREDIDEYRARFRQAGASRPEYSCLQTGPWPPYSFVKTDPR